MFVVIIDGKDTSAHTNESDALSQKQRYINSGTSEIAISIVEKNAFVLEHEMLLEETKEWKKSLINNLREQKLTNGYTDQNNITWSSNSSDIINLSGVCTLIALGVVTEIQTWRDQDNNNHEMTPSALVALAGGLAYHSKLCYVTSWTHKANIETLTTIEDVLAYDITTDWPSF